MISSQMHQFLGIHRVDFVRGEEERNIVCEKQNHGRMSHRLGKDQYIKNK